MEQISVNLEPLERIVHEYAANQGLIREAHEIIRDQVKKCQVEEDELTCDLCAHADTCRAYQWLERMEA